MVTDAPRVSMVSGKSRVTSVNGAVAVERPCQLIQPRRLHILPLPPDAVEIRVVQIEQGL